MKNRNWVYKCQIWEQIKKAQILAQENLEKKNEID